MKKLKFEEPLPELVISGKKNTTWRIDDEKELDVGNELSLCKNNEEEFARAEIIWIKKTTFENLTFKDKEGHEKFNSDEDMYATYSKYMDREVNSKTKLKVVKFKILF